MSANNHFDQEIQSLVDWPPPSEGKILLGAVLGAAVSGLFALGVAALGASWFDLDRTQQSIVFAGSFIAFGRMADTGHYPTIGHVALAAKALVLVSLRRP